MSAADEQLGQVQRLLKSDKQKDRKDGVKLLDSLLDSRDCLERLDRRTACLWPEDKIPVPSWPGVLDMYVNFLARELQASSGKRKPMDSLFLRVLKKLLQRADNEQRCGRTDNLLRRASKLMVHIRDALVVDGALTGQPGLDYAAILRNQLLPNAKYCQQCTVVTFQDMLDALHSRMEQVMERSSSGGAVPTDELLRLATTEQLLFQHMPGALTPSFREDAVAFFALTFKWLDERRDTSRLATLLLQSLLQLLLECGRDVVQHLPKLHHHMQRYFRHAWKETRNQKHKEVLVNYMRVALQLGGLTAEAVSETLALISFDIKADGFKWEPEGKGEAAAALSKYHHALMALAASLHYYQAQAPARAEEPLEEDDAEHLPRKRRRTLPPHATLIDAALAAPARWGPVLAAMLRMHGHALPAAAFQAVLAGVAARMQGALKPAGGDVGAGGSSAARDAAAPQQLLWLLRIAQDLAVAWPVELHPLAAAAAARAAAAAGRSEFEAAGTTAEAQHWKRLLAVVTDALSLSDAGNGSGSISGSRKEAAVWLLQALLQRHLVDVPAKPAVAARLASFASAPLSHAPLALLAELFAAEPCGSQPEAEARERLLQLCLQTLPQAASSPGMLQALLAAVSALVAGSRGRLAAAAAALEARGRSSGPELAGGAGVFTAAGDGLNAVEGSQVAHQWWVLDAETARLDAQVRDLESVQELLTRRLEQIRRQQLEQQLQAVEAPSHDAAGSDGVIGSQGDAAVGQPPLDVQLQGRLVGGYASRLHMMLQTLGRAASEGAVADEGSYCQLLAASAAAAAVLADVQQAQQLPQEAVSELTGLASALLEAIMQAAHRCKEQLSDPLFGARQLRLLQTLAVELAQLQIHMPKAANGSRPPLAKQLIEAVGRGPVDVVLAVVLEAIATVEAALTAQRPNSANGTTTEAGAAAVEYEDDDDFAALAPPQLPEPDEAQGPGAGPSTAAGLHPNAPFGSGRELQALRSLTALAPAAAAPVAAAAVRLWQEVRRQSGVPAEEVQAELARAMVAAVCAGGAWDGALPAVRMLGPEQGLLSGRPKDTPSLGRLHLVLRLLEQLLLAALAQGQDLAASGGQGSEGQEGGGSALDAMAQVLVAVEDRMILAQEVNMDQGSTPVDPSPPALLLQFGATISALMRTAPALFRDATSSVAHLPARLGQLLDCHHAAARRAAAMIAAARITDEPAPPAGAPPAFARLQQHMQLNLTRQLQGGDVDRCSNGEEGGLAEYGDSAVLQVVELAAASPGLEAAALQMLCCHAARTAGTHAVVQAALNLMAAQRHYCSNPSSSSGSAGGHGSMQSGISGRSVDDGRARYLRFHAPQLLWSWFECGLTLQHLLSIRDLFAAGQGSNVAAFLGPLVPWLLAAIFRGDQQPLLVELCEALGTDQRALVSSHIAAILAAFLPRIQEDAAGVSRALQGNCMMGSLDEETLERLTVASVGDTIEHMLLLCAEVATPDGSVQIGGTPPGPFFGAEHVVTTAEQLKASSSNSVTRQLLSPRHVQSLLLAVHRHLLAASHPPHRLRLLGALRALLQLLGPQAAEPATARYALHILLQLLPAPQLQPAACALLLQLVGLLQAAAAPLGPTKGPSRKGAAVSAGAGGSGTALALLGELLPSMVSVLVQCLEARVVARQGLALQITAGLAAAKLGQAAAARAAPPAAAHAASVAQDVAENALVSTLLVLTVQASPQLQPYLAAVDPLPLLPTLPQLAQARELQSRVRSQVLLPQELASFAERAASMTQAARQRALQALTAGLQQRRHEIMQPPDAEAAAAVAAEGQLVAGAGGSHAGDVRSDVVASAWRLARLAAEMDDAAISSLAGELLAAAGPLDPLAMAFDIPGAGDVADAGLAGGVSSAGSAAAVGTGSLGVPAARAAKNGAGAGDKAAHEPPRGQLGALLQQVLLQLGQCLVEEDVRLIGVAQRTLALLLQAPEARTALAGLADAAAAVDSGTAAQQRERLAVLQQCLAVYLPADASATLPNITGTEALEQSLCPHSATAAAEAARGAGLPVDAPELWRPAAKGFERWLCDLCSTLLRHCSGAPVLQLLASAAALRPQLAQLLLPHALQEVVSAAGAGGGGGELPRQMHVGVLGAPECDLRAVRVVLRALEQLRHTHRAALVAANGNPPQDTKSPFYWRRCYCLDLSYLAVAQAAMRCNAYFTALLYVEHWCEEAHGTLTLTSGASSEEHGVMGFLRQLQDSKEPQAASAGATAARPAQQQQQQQQQQELLAEQLLLEFYSNVTDPDGIYAVAALMGSPAAQLQLLRHEGSWAQVLSGHDLLLQRRGQAAGGQTGAGRVGLARAAQESQAGQTHGLLFALQHLGCLHTAQRYLAGHQAQAVQQDPVLLDAQHELAWRLSQWQDTQPAQQPRQGQQQQQQQQQDGSFHEAVLGALRALQAGDQEQFQGLIAAAGHGRVKQLASISAESAASVNPTLLQLQMLQLLRRAWPMKWHSSGTAAAAGPSAAVPAGQALRASQLSPEQLLDQLQGGLSAPSGQLQGSDYRLVDLLQSLQHCVLAVLNRPDAVAEALQRSATSARKAGQHTAAEAALGQLRQLLVHCNSGTANGAAAGGQAWVMRMARADSPWLLESAKLLWAQGQAVPAIKAVHSVVQGMEALLTPTPAPPRTKRGQQAQQQQQVAPLALAEALALQAKWVAQAHYEGSSGMGGVLDTLKAASELAATAAGSSSAGSAAGSEALLRCKVFFRLASYADERYRDAVRQRSSPEWRIQQGVVARKRAEAATLMARTREQSLNEAARKYAANMAKKMEKQVQLDEAVMKAVTANEASCRAIALANYTSCLLAGPTHDLPVVFRLCQLWFEQSEDAQVNAALAAAFAQVPSHKFVPLVYQIASRLSTGGAPGSFQSVLADALVRLGRDHPYHSLYQLFALRNGNLGADGKPNRDNIIMSFSTDMDKLNAARIILERVASSGKRSQEIIRQVDVLVAAYVELAAAKVPPNLTEMAFPSNIRRRMCNLDQVPVVSLQQPVDPSCRYEGLPTVKDFYGKITFAGGINAPKVIRCIDDRGGEHRQLVKSGNDDLRQDAIMQQFFGLVNSLLASHQVTARRRLSMGTYKVVPFSPASGLVEWVEHTLPLTAYLVGSSTRENGAHARYRRPGDWDYAKCSRHLASSEPQQLRQRFDEVCAHFHPVLHHFFLEAFPAPARWFEARTNYARATAVSSMAGYVLGLGDRHSGNILLDVRSARVVHIDLGIAFEQGRLLNTAEVVPFRLTRDIVDGLGANGVEGAMRRCCEATLQVLRSSRDALLTVVGVVLHDPLYKWAMTPVRARRRQHAMDEGDSEQQAAEDAAANAVSGNDYAELGNADAERAVLRVKQKLEGVDGGEGEPRGVEGQVQALLQEAQDPERLCRMYAGWAAFM